MNNKEVLEYSSVISFLKKIIRLLEEDKYIGLKEYKEFTKEYYNLYRKLDLNNEFYKPLSIIYNQKLLKNV